MFCSDQSFFWKACLLFARVWITNRWSLVHVQYEKIIIEKRCSMVTPVRCKFVCYSSTFHDVFWGSVLYNDAKFTSWFSVSVTNPMVYQAAFAQRPGVACRNLQSFWFISFDTNFYWSQHWFTWPLPRRKCDYLWVITDIKTRATCMPDFQKSNRQTVWSLFYF